MPQTSGDARVLMQVEMLARQQVLGLVRLAGSWWLVLICCERKILLAGW
jgi:hypothetical protein